MSSLKWVQTMGISEEPQPCPLHQKIYILGPNSKFVKQVGYYCMSYFIFIHILYLRDHHNSNKVTLGFCNLN